MGDHVSRIFAPRPDGDTLKIGDEISRGAYGTVYRGILGKTPVAIKKIHQLLLDCAKERREVLELVLKGFRDECELMEAAKHANVVEFIGVYYQDGSALLVMELMDITLSDFLENKQGTLPLWSQIHICLQIALGLLFLHEHDPQILHRDLTAKNVLMNREGNIVKISDLGQAKFRPASVMYLTTKAPGCIAYMPPECLVDQPHFTDKGDMFSLGVVALQVTTQHPPSVGIMIVKDQPELERRAADLARLPDAHPMQPQIYQCLQDNPAKRPDCREIVHELRTEAEKHIPPKDWTTLGDCQKVITHSPMGSRYRGITVSSQGFLAVTDGGNYCIHLLTTDGELMRSIGKGALGGGLFGVAFDLKGNIWVTDSINKVVKLSQDGRPLLTIHCADGESDWFDFPCGLSVSPEGLIYICDRDNDRVTVHNEEGKFLFALGSKENGPGCFDGPHDILFGSDGLVYITDYGNKRVCMWSKEGTFKRDFRTKYNPDYIATSNDNHLLITSCYANAVMVYTFEGELVHEFGENGSDPGKFNEPMGIICKDGSVYVADYWNKRVQVF